LFLTETKIEGSSLRFCVFRPVFFEFEALPGRPVRRQILVSWPMSHALSVALWFYGAPKYLARAWCFVSAG
jgi:hypothetical protein